MSIIENIDVVQNSITRAIESNDGKFSTFITLCRYGLSRANIPFQTHELLNIIKCVIKTNSVYKIDEIFDVFYITKIDRSEYNIFNIIKLVIVTKNIVIVNKVIDIFSDSMLDIVHNEDIAILIKDAIEINNIDILDKIFITFTKRLSSLSEDILTDIVYNVIGNIETTNSLNILRNVLVSLPSIKTINIKKYIVHSIFNMDINSLTICEREHVLNEMLA
jgi:BarA-like signal transduction histidine kinase